MPLVYGIVTSLKTDNQITTLGAPWWPASARTFNMKARPTKFTGWWNATPTATPSPGDATLRTLSRQMCAGAAGP
jgi:hypothetical protein